MVQNYITGWMTAVTTNTSSTAAAAKHVTFKI